jgi:hypothetical protein
METVLNRKLMVRLCIYPKDIQIVTGKSERYGRRLLKKIKDDIAKENHQYITVEEFCTFTGLKIDEVNRVLKH